MSNYNCLHIITRFANGGAEETVLDLIVQLANRGIYCDLAVGKEVLLGVLEKYDIPEGCKIHTIPHMVRAPHMIYDFKAFHEIRSLIRIHNYNIVHTHGSKAGILGRVAAYKEHVPLIIGMIHGISFPAVMPWFFRTLYKHLERYAAKRSHVLVCVGKDMQQKYLEAKIGKESQYSVIYTGMRLPEEVRTIREKEDKVCEVRGEFGISQDPETVVLGAIGRLEDRKNQKDLITILSKALQEYPSLHLVLIGDGPNMRELLVYAQKLGIADHVSFTGYISDVWRIMPAVDIHCMVSLWEGLPRVLVQTSFAGIPNICFQVDGAWEIIEHEKSGYIVSRGDMELYKAHIVSLAQNKKLRKSLGAHAESLADDRWSIDRFCEETIQLYDSLLKASL